MENYYGVLSAIPGGDIQAYTIKNDFSDSPGAPSTAYLLVIQTVDTDGPLMMRVIGCTKQTALGWHKRGELPLIEPIPEFAAVIRRYFLERQTCLQRMVSRITESEVVSELVH